jgi:chorismate--pyruvate lyase
MSLQESLSIEKRLRGRTRRSRWQPMGQIYSPPTEICPWLNVKTSLTRKLEATHGRVRVRLLRQQVDSSLADEASCARRPCVVRDVVLENGAGLPLVMAHSVIALMPRGALHPWIKRLGRQALGSLLFTRSGFVRRQREYALLDARHPLYRQAKKIVGDQLPPTIWARRASFSPIRSWRQTVQVTELFLDAKSPARAGLLGEA